MNIIKSIAVLFFLVFVVWVAIRMICNCYHAYKLNSLSGIKVVSSVSVLIITILLCLNLYEYTYPFERKIPFEHVETIELSEDYALSYPGSIFWHSSYEFEYLFGVFYAKSLYFDPNERISHLGFQWPEMDLKHHTYIITYGQELESISYNVWEKVEVPVRTGAVVGHATLSNQFTSNKIYIYQIRKMRIDNDP